MAAQMVNLNNAPVISLLSTITDDHGDWNILVRVLRMWRVPDVNPTKLPWSLELVLMDTEGTKIHATVKKQLLYKFEKEIKEGCVYYIVKFVVAANIGDYRTNNHPFKLNFHLHTKIRKATDAMVPPAVYTFTPPISCFEPEFDFGILVDIIGVLTGVGQQRDYVRNGVKSKLITIDLDNMGYRFKLTLFGHLIDELNSFMSVGDNVNGVVAVLFCKVKDFQGHPAIQSTMHSTRLILNPVVPEVAELRNNVAQNQESPNPGLSQIQEAKVSNLEDDLIYQTAPITITPLKEYKEAGLFVVLATVANVLHDGDWWYSSCICSKKVYADENSYFCSKCNKHVFTVTPRYLLKLKVTDATGSATFVLFEDEASVLTNKSCALLLETMENPNSFGFPKEISSLIGKEFLFKVQCAVSADTRSERTFRVKKVSGDTDILQKFKDKWDLENTVDHDSISSMKTMVSVGAELAADVAQDLMSKFSDSTKKGKEVIIDDQVIDLCGPSQEPPYVKRVCPFVNSGSEAFVLLKEIKKEKEKE